MKNYIRIENEAELNVLLEFFEDSGYDAHGGMKMILAIVGKDNYPIVVAEEKKDKVVALKHFSLESDADDSFEAYCEALDSEDVACFYSNLTDYLDYNVPTMDSSFPDWTWDLNEEEPVAIVNGKRYVSEMTLSAAWPDHLCRRVRIDGVYYFCS